MESAPENKVVLEKVSEADFKRYLELQKGAESETYAPVEDEGEITEDLKKGSVLLIKKGNEVIGTISYHIREDKNAYISGFVIDKKYRGEGFGREALEQVLMAVKDAPKVELITHPNNSSALQLYTSFGFKIIERKENYYGNGESRVVLALNRS
jgi:ribosomal protein S18 acetylase RimI-like enzyme